MTNNSNRRPITWTPQMLKLLRDYYPTMFNKPLAKWIGVSLRSLQRKAKELGIEKVENFNQVRADDISKLLSDAGKRCYAEGRRQPAYPKGVRCNPDYEFKPGHRNSPEVEEARIAKIRRTFKKRKLLKIYGLTR